MKNLVRIARANEHGLPLKRSTLYKWLHIKKYPQMFIKLGGAVFVDLDKMNEILEAGRQKG